MVLFGFILIAVGLCGMCFSATILLYCIWKDL